MTRKILIDGQRAEELRVAIVNNRLLEDYEIEVQRSGLTRNNIYRGTVINIEPSLNAAFVDFGQPKHGFLAFNDVVESVFHKPIKDPYARLNISDVLVPGQTLIVQVLKEAQELKGAQITTNISLAGRYIVLRPKDAKSGISRKVDDEARADLAEKAKMLDLPEGCGSIIRTNALDQSKSILQRDANALLQLWNKIEEEAHKATTPQLLYDDQDLVVQAMRDYFEPTISEVLIDDESCYKRAKAYVHATMPSLENKIKRYQDRTPIFTKFDIERQIANIYDRRVNLPSGGFIVIDPTEALTAIDVNSSKSTKAGSQDLTAYHTNLEATAEIARQLRFRDLGGLIVIDFIDMKPGRHQRDIERAMREAMSRDKARNRVERISPNGLLEINRQRIRQSINRRTHHVCEACAGKGYIPSIEMQGLSIIRQIEAKAVEGKISKAVVKLHPDIAQGVQNQRRHDIFALENEFDISIEIIASNEIPRSSEIIEWHNNVSTKNKKNIPLKPMSVADTAPDEPLDTHSESSPTLTPMSTQSFTSPQSKLLSSFKSSFKFSSSASQEQNIIETTQVEENNYQQRDRENRNNYQQRDKTGENNYQQRDKTNENNYQQRDKTNENNYQQRDKTNENNYQQRDKTSENNYQQRDKTSESTTEPEFSQYSKKRDDNDYKKHSSGSRRVRPPRSSRLKENRSYSETRPSLEYPSEAPNELPKLETVTEAQATAQEELKHEIDTTLPHRRKERSVALEQKTETPAPETHITSPEPQTSIADSEHASNYRKISYDNTEKQELKEEATTNSRRRTTRRSRPSEQPLTKELPFNDTPSNTETNSSPETITTSLPESTESTTITEKPESEQSTRRTRTRRTTSRRPSQTLIQTQAVIDESPIIESSPEQPSVSKTEQTPSNESEQEPSSSQHLNNEDEEQQNDSSTRRRRTSRRASSSPSSPNTEETAPQDEPEMRRRRTRTRPALSSDPAQSQENPNPTRQRRTSRRRPSAENDAQ